LKSRWYRGVVIVAVVAVLAMVLRTCTSGSDLLNSPPGEESEAELTLQSVTLEQPDEDGNLLWRLKANTVNYTPDTERAELQDLEGESFQDGNVIYTVTADEGEVLQNGETLFLRGNLVANGEEDELTLESERLKWVPKEDLLVMGNFEDNALDDADQADSELADSIPTDAEKADVEKAPVTGFNPQLEAIAQIVTVKNRENRVDLSGGVVAKSKETPWLTFESDALSWFTQRKVIEANQPLKVEQFESDIYQTVSDRIIGSTGQVDLAENVVTLDDSVQLDALTQPLTVTSEQAIWDVDAELVNLDLPVRIVQPEEQVTATANRARLDLAQQTAELIGDVRAVGTQNDSRLAADAVTWQTTTQQVEANGNVIYQQAADPEISMAGTRAVGNIEDGTLVVTGGEEGEVITEIIPEGF